MAKQQARQRANQSGGRGERAQEQAPQSGSGAQNTRTEGDAEDDYVYGLASVLYHALQGVTAARKYAEDARRAGVEDLVEFFEECRREGTARAKQAKSLLVSYSDEEDEEGDEDEEEDEEDEEDES